MGRIFPHVLAYPDQNAEKSCKGGGGEGEGELSRIEHAAKQQLIKVFLSHFSYLFIKQTLLFNQFKTLLRSKRGFSGCEGEGH